MADEKKDPFSRIKEGDSPKKEAPEETQEKRTPKWILWVVIPLVGIGLSVGAFFLAEYILIPRFNHYKQAKQGNGNEIEDRKEQMGYTYAIGDLTVNTYQSDGRRFVLAAFIIESDAKKVIEEVRNREPQIRDEFIKYLRRHTAQQILDQSFQDNSKRELMEAINQRLSTGDITSLYYTKLVLQ